jgi:hypothetical protein
MLKNVNWPNANWPIVICPKVKWFDKHQLVKCLMKKMFVSLLNVQMSESPIFDAQMSVGPIYVGKMFYGQMAVGQMSVGQIVFDQKTLSQSYWMHFMTLQKLFTKLFFIVRILILRAYNFVHSSMKLLY